MINSVAEAASQTSCVVAREALLLDAMTGQHYAIPEQGAIVGREETCDVVLRDGAVSGVQFMIYRLGDGWFLEDAHSTNGTRVNHRRVGKTRLTSTDRIDVGKTVLVFLKREVPADEDCAASGPIDQRKPTQ